MRVSFYRVPGNAWLFRPPVADDNCSHPEEETRQWCIHELLHSYGVCIRDIDVEYAVRVARERKPHRVDILVVRDGKPYIVIECKARGEKDHGAAMAQAINYASLPDVNAEFAVYTNGDVWWVRRRVRGQWVDVPDIPMLHDHKATEDWRDILLAVGCLSPVLFWLDEVVPAKTAPSYFGALQEFFHSENEATIGTDRRLLWTADHVLRVLDDVTRHPNYTGGKMSHACDGLNKYWQERGVEPSFGGGDLWEMAHHAWADLSHLLDGARGTVSLDYQAMRVIQALLSYLNSMRGRRVQYQDVGAPLQSEIREYVDLALTLRFNAPLPDIGERCLVEDVRKACRPLWSEHLKAHWVEPWPRPC